MNLNFQSHPNSGFILCTDINDDNSRDCPLSRSRHESHGGGHVVHPVASGSGKQPFSNPQSQRHLFSLWLNKSRRTKKGLLGQSFDLVSSSSSSSPCRTVTLIPFYTSWQIVVVIVLWAIQFGPVLGLVATWAQRTQSQFHYKYKQHPGGYLTEKSRPKNCPAQEFITQGHGTRGHIPTEGDSI